jgi:hypothetical protein
MFIMGSVIDAYTVDESEDGIKKDCLEYEAKVAVTKDLENVCWSELDETSYPKTILENTFDEVYFSPFLE